MGTAVTAHGTTLADGWLTIPPEVQEALGLTPGQAVEFEVRGGTEVFMRPGLTARERVERVRGILRDGPTSDEILDMTRGTDR